jgi:hypothetical protein
MFLFRFDALFLLRYAAGRFLASLFHDPPRKQRTAVSEKPRSAYLFQAFSPTSDLPSNVAQRCRGVQELPVVEQILLGGQPEMHAQQCRLLIGVDQPFFGIETGDGEGDRSEQSPGVVKDCVSHDAV